MLLLKLVLFIGMFLGIVYGIEYVLPPFSQFYYTNPLDILISLSYSLSYKVGVSSKISLALVILIIGFIPLLIVIWLGKVFKTKRKKRYRFK